MLKLLKSEKKLKNNNTNTNKKRNLRERFGVGGMINIEFVSSNNNAYIRFSFTSLHHVSMLKCHSLNTAFRLCKHVINCWLRSLALFHLLHFNNHGPSRRFKHIL